MLIPLHGIASRHDLPLPFPFVITGAALALVLSFAVLLGTWRTPRWRQPAGRPLPDLTALVDARAFRTTARLVVLALYLWVGLALLFGRDRLTNPTFGFVFAWVWVGLVPLSLLFGPVWRVLNPLRTVHAGLCRILRLPVDGVRPLPSRLGIWPGAVGLAAFAWLELVQPDRATLPVLRSWVLAWLVVQLGGGLVFGRAWFAAADPFEVYAERVAQLAPLARVRRRIVLTNPLRHVVSSPPVAGAGAVVAVLLGSTAFDSFSNTTWWIATTQDSAVSPALWGTAGLAVMIAIVAATFALGSLPFGRPPWGADRVASAATPIIVGYAIAHYFSLLLVEGQRTALGLSDPMGLGWNVFGTAELGVNTAIFDHPTALAVIQLVAIVGGHLVGVLCAHDLGLRLNPGTSSHLGPPSNLEPASTGARPAHSPLTAQVPMLAVMVAYTCAGLVLLFSP